MNLYRRSRYTLGYRLICNARFIFTVCRVIFFISFLFVKTETKDEMGILSNVAFRKSTSKHAQFKLHRLFPALCFALFITNIVIVINIVICFSGENGDANVCGATREEFLQSKISGAWREEAKVRIQPTVTNSEGKGVFDSH